MYLPSEGLYAEVLRRPGLTETLQREWHITVAGPMTLAALLNSLQMGFRTLAIEQRSTEVWQILSHVKLEFGKFGDLLDKVKRNLTAAANTIDDAGVRTRAIERRLDAVQSLPTAAPGNSCRSRPRLPQGSRPRNLMRNRRAARYNTENARPPSAAHAPATVRSRKGTSRMHRSHRVLALFVWGTCLAIASVAGAIAPVGQGAAAVKKAGIAPLPSPHPTPKDLGNIPWFQKIGIAPIPSPLPRPATAIEGIAPLPSPHPIPATPSILQIWDTQLRSWSLPRPLGDYLRRSNFLLTVAVQTTRPSEAAKNPFYARLARLGTAEEQPTDRSTIDQELQKMLGTTDTVTLQKFLWHVVMEDVAKLELTHIDAAQLYAVTNPMEPMTLALLAAERSRRVRPSFNADPINVAHPSGIAGTPTAPGRGGLLACLGTSLSGQRSLTASSSNDSTPIGTSVPDGGGTTTTGNHGEPTPRDPSAQPHIGFGGGDDCYGRDPTRCNPQVARSGPVGAPPSPPSGQPPKPGGTTSPPSGDRSSPPTTNRPDTSDRSGYARSPHAPQGVTFPESGEAGTGGRDPGNGGSTGNDGGDPGEVGSDGGNIATPTPDGIDSGGRGCNEVNLQAMVDCLFVGNAGNQADDCYQYKLGKLSLVAQPDPNATNPCGASQAMAMGAFGNVLLWDPILELNGPAARITPMSTPIKTLLDQLPTAENPAKSIEPNPSS